MLQFIILTIAFQTFFLLVFDVFLKKETFFNWNRLYLISTAILSVILPFVKVESFKNVLPKQYIIKLPEVFIGEEVKETTTKVVTETIAPNVQYVFNWEVFLYVGMFLAAILFFFKIIKICWLLYKNPKSKIDRFNIIKLLNCTAAFSFFNYIFLGECLTEEEKASILKHEIVHVKQKHTLDLLFFEVLRIIFWYNPLVYMYQNRIMVIHEFIADAEAIKHENKSSYYQNLLSQVFQIKNISFINPFFKQSLIKKRIVMLQKSKSKQINLFKYALIIPVVLGMLIYNSSYAQEKNLEVIEEVVEIVKLEDTPLVNKLSRLTRQIQVQGNISDEENNGLELLLKIAKQDVLDSNLIGQVQTFMNRDPKTTLISKISDVFQQIQIQGNISNEEEKALKKLLVLTSNNGLNDPFFADIIDEVEIPYGVIDQPPVFPGCEDLKDEAQKKCTSNNIANHVNKNFNTKLSNDLKLTGKQRINVIFKINTDGNIIGVRSRAPHPELEKEAIRVVNLLPKMIPGEQKGKKVNVPYSLPIIFQVADNKKND